jgi:hypothetical protein
VISDLDIVRACQASYAAAASIPQTSPWWPYVALSPPAAAGEPVLVINRGSETWQDWLRDFMFRPVTVREHPQLGACHAGILEGALAIVDQLDAALAGRPAIYGGHSLGGAEAVAQAALMAARGKPPIAVVTFGAPRLGMARLVEFLGPYALRPYRRGNDIVPEVPRCVPPAFPFLDSRAPLIAIGAPEIDFFSCHHIDGYAADVQAYLAARVAAA